MPDNDDLATYSVWIKDGLEANDYYLTLDEAKSLQFELKTLGYESQIVDTKEAK